VIKKGDCMCPIYYNIYSDESGIDGSGDFNLGALLCTPARARILRNGLKKVRNKHNYTSEIKWNRVSRFMLPICMDFADVFIDDPFARIIIMKVHRNNNWRNWATTEGERFFKTYYVFLRRMMLLSCRYNIFPDETSNRKRYSWDSLYFAIINKTKRDYLLKSKHISKFQPLDSKKEDLLQMVDLFLGALTSKKATAKHKVELAKNIRQSEAFLEDPMPRINEYEWTPTICQT